jgi:hypothetical protein
LPHSVDRFRYFVVDRGAPHSTWAAGFLTIDTGGGFAKVPLEGGVSDASHAETMMMRAPGMKSLGLVWRNTATVHFEGRAYT